MLFPENGTNKLPGIFGTNQLPRVVFKEAVQFYEGIQGGLYFSTKMELISCRKGYNATERGNVGSIHLTCDDARTEL